MIIRTNAPLLYYTTFLTKTKKAMKSLLSIMAICIITTSLMAQTQLNANFNAGGKISAVQNADSFPEMIFESQHGTVGKIGFTPGTNEIAPNNENVTLNNASMWGEVRLKVSSGELVVNPNQMGLGAYVGINTQNPIASLSVNSLNNGATADFLSTNSNKAYIQFSGNNGTSHTSKGFLGVLDQSENLSIGTFNTNTTGHLFFETQNQKRMFITNTGQTFIGDITDFSNSLFSNPASLNICGNARASGNFNANAFTCNSDERYKTAIKPIENALKKVEQLNGVNYFWNTKAFPKNGFSNTLQTGLIAQQVETIFPELVSTNEIGYKSVDYVSLTAVLVEAIKEQQQKITQLEMQITKTASLENRLEALEQALKKSEVALKIQ